MFGALEGIRYKTGKNQSFFFVAGNKLNMSLPLCTTSISFIK